MPFNFFKEFIHDVRLYIEYRYFVNNDLRYIYVCYCVVMGTMKNNNRKFERFVVLKIERLREKMGVPQRVLGEALGGKHTTNPAAIWQRVLGKSSKPQKLSIEDYMSVASALDKNPIEYLVYLETLFKTHQ